MYFKSMDYNLHDKWFEKIFFFRRNNIYEHIYQYFDWNEFKEKHPNIFCFYSKYAQDVQCM